MYNASTGVIVHHGEELRALTHTLFGSSGF
jgi:hypothetical protein